MPVERICILREFECALIRRVCGIGILTILAFQFLRLTRPCRLGQWLCRIELGIVLLYGRIECVQLRSVVRIRLRQLALCLFKVFYCKGLSIERICATGEVECALVRRVCGIVLLTFFLCNLVSILSLLVLV